MKNKLKMSIFCFAILGLTGCVTLPTVNLPTFNSWRPVPLQNGGCNIQYEMNNTFDFTLSIHADVTLLDEQGNTLGSTIAIFPPVLPGRSGKVNVLVPPYNISSGSCRDAKKLRLQATICKREDDGAYLNSGFCSQIKAFHTINNY